MICRDLDVDRALQSRQRELALIEGRGPRVSDFIINSYSSGPPGDPYWSNVTSLLHFDGSDGSSTFTDQIARTWTRVGSPVISTAQSLFGGASGRFPGSNSLIYAPNSDAGFNFGAGDFTLEIAFRLDSVVASGNAPRLVSNWSTSGNLSYLWSIFNNAGTTNMVFAYSSNGSSTVVFNFPFVPAANIWYRAAVCRSTTSIRAYVDGAQIGTTQSIGSTSLYFPSQPTTVGGLNGSAITILTGYFDEMRVTKAARYTGSSYTVDAIPFPDS